IREAQVRVAEAVRQEEERFAETLDLGMAKIREYLEAHRGDATRTVDGRLLFTLYDTHGFPSDLAQEVFADAGWTVTPETQQAFDAEMEAQRERARAGASFGGESDDPSVAIYQRLSGELAKPTFLGYASLTAPARLPALVGGGQAA